LARNGFLAVLERMDGSGDLTASPALSLCASTVRPLLIAWDATPTVQRRVKQLAAGFDLSLPAMGFEAELHIRLRHFLQRQQAKSAVCAPPSVHPRPKHLRPFPLPVRRTASSFCHQFVA